MDDINQNDKSTSSKRDERVEQLEKMREKLGQQTSSLEERNSIEILKPLKKKILIWMLVFLAVNLVFVLIDNHESLEPDLEGKVHSGWDMKIRLVSTLTISCAILSFILGAVLSLIPYKNFEYKQKYLFFCFVSFLLVQLLFFFFEALNLLMR